MDPPILPGAFAFDPLLMATHSTTLAWKIPWTEEPGRLLSMGSQRIGHDRVTSLSLWPPQHIGSFQGCHTRHIVVWLLAFLHSQADSEFREAHSHKIKRCLLLGRNAMTNPESILKSRDIILPTKFRLVKAIVFPIVMCGCESWTIKKAWVLKNGCFWTVMLEKTLESPLDCKEIQPVHPEGDQSWIVIGRTDAETPILWPPDEKNWLIGKDPDAGKDWKWEEKGTTEEEMVGWHHQLNGREFEQAPGVGGGQRSLACCYVVEKSQTWLSDWTELKWTGFQ